MGNKKKISRNNNSIFCCSRDTIVTFDRQVNIVNETECLHKLGLSKELRGGAKSQYDIEQARALLPEAFSDFATRKVFVICQEIILVYFL